METIEQNFNEQEALQPDEEYYLDPFDTEIDGQPKKKKRKKKGPTSSPPPPKSRDGIVTDPDTIRTDRSENTGNFSEQRTETDGEAT